MSGKTKGNKRQQAQNEEALALTRDEEKMAKYVRFNCATKKANLHGVKVDFFIASKAVDVLMDSKWAKGDEPALATRQSAVALMRKLMSLEFFNRTVKVYKEQAVESAKPSSQKFDTTTTESAAVENTPTKARKRKGGEQAQQSDATPKGSPAAADAEKQKKKYEIVLHRFRSRSVHY
jgi:translocation protein SEC62